MKRTIIFSAILKLSISCTSSIATEIEANDIVVTASRFKSDQVANPNVKIITKSDIQNSASVNLPDLFRNIAGINVQSVYGNTGNDSLVDLRGFGDSAGSNTLILLNGQRLNNPDSSNIVWPSIPIRSIERIEILPGSGAVLYGDRASSGVINIITDKSGEKIQSAGASFGSNGFKSADGYISGELGENGYYNSYIKASSERGYRDNSSFESYALNGTIGSNDTFSAFLDYGLFDIKNELPGSLIEWRYRLSDRKAYYSNTSVQSNNTQSKNGIRLRPGFSLYLSDALTFSNELSFSIERQNSHYPDPDLYGDATNSGRNIYGYSITPKLKYEYKLFGMPNKSIIGFDYYYGKFIGKSEGILESVNNNHFTQNASQRSNAIYLQNETELSKQLAIKLGYRTQKTDQVAEKSEFYYWGDLNPAVKGSMSKRQNAYDLMLRYNLGTFSTYYSHSKSFRIANLDELYGFENYVPTFYGNMLKPQIGKNNEVGATYNSSSQFFRASYYQNKLENEIGWDNNRYMNVNFDKTMHRGFEFEYKQVLSDSLSNRLTMALQNAQFTDGMYDGNDLPNIPKKILTNQTTYDSHNYGKYTLQVNSIDPRYFTNDLQNVKKELPGYTTIDLRAAAKILDSELSLIVINLLDKKYSPTAVSGASGYYYYPANGRGFYLGIKRDF